MKKRNGTLSGEELEDLHDASYDDKSNDYCSCDAGDVQKASERQHFAEKPNEKRKCEPPSCGTDQDATDDKNTFKSRVMNTNEREGTHENEQGQRIGYGEEKR